MRLRTWALSMNSEGTKSTVNCQYLDGPFRWGCLATRPGVTISAHHTEKQAVPFARLYFYLPQLNANTSMPGAGTNSICGTDDTQPFGYLLRTRTRHNRTAAVCRSFRTSTNKGGHE